MKVVTPLELRDVLAEVNRPQPVSIIALVEPEVRRANYDLPGRLLKLSRYRAWIGKFENMVNNQIAREGNADILHFVAAPRQWGVHHSLALVGHCTKDGEQRWYLSVQVLQVPKSPLYLVEHVAQTYRRRRMRLVAIAKEKIAHVLPAPRSAPRYQAVDKPVIHRDIELKHITWMALDSEVYRVEDRA